MTNRFNNQMEVLFYKYGLFSSRHPILMIFVSAVIILSCCYPLLNLPIPGSEPQQFFTLLNDVATNRRTPNREDFPSWFAHANRTAFIQQFVVKFSTAAWSEKEATKSQMTKASLYSVFSILDEVKKFSVDNGLSIDDSCFHVTTTAIKTKQQLKSMFPENDCLLVSPASYWKNEPKEFVADKEIQKTIDQFESKTLRPPPSVKELMFGLTSKHINLKLKKSVITYTITLVLKKYDAKLIQNLEKHLHSIYSEPVLTPCQRICEVEKIGKNKEICSNLSRVVTHIHYRAQIRFNDLLPLLSTYFVLGCYIYFSVRKINFVKSKVGMAFAAVVSVIASLMMAVGLCSLIGLTPKLNGGEMFPYLVCFVGLENILVITKSVVATHSHLDVDKRIAIGLSREGGPIIKNFLLELVLIALGYFTYVPQIREFCAFAFVGILTDFFIGIFFFVSILSLDIRRLDVEDPYQEPANDDTELLYPVQNKTLKKRNWKKLSNSASTHSAENGGRAESILKIPKRMRVIFFFADTRMVQRGLMFMLVVWFSVLVYSDPAGLFNNNQSSHSGQSHRLLFNLDAVTALKEMDEAIPSNKKRVNWGFKDVLSSHYLSFRHWPTLFAYYNITLAEKFISVLPPILIPIAPMKDVREIIDDQADKEQESLKPPSTESPDVHHFNLAIDGYNPMTGFEYYVTLIMGAVSGILLVFLLNIMYQCICSRRYVPPPPVTDPGECSQIRLRGHQYKVDPVCVEGVTVTSADISGQIRTWDTHSGDCISIISRENLDLPNESTIPTNRFQYNPPSPNSEGRSLPGDNIKPSVWSVVSSGQFIIVGCSNGQIEVWDSASSTLQCKFTTVKDGVVGLACEDRRIVAARITGRLDFFALEDFMEQQRTHKRTPSDILLHNPAGNIVNLHLLNTVKSAHQQPICAFEMCMRRILTGSRDHTLKLYNFQDAKCQFTMFGHSSPITVVYMDKQTPAGAVSGSTDGTVWLWDLLSGKGVHKMKKHKGAILSAQCTMHYIVSSAEDIKMCVWSRRTGSLLHIVPLDSASCTALSLLGRSWCVTGGKGCLFLWDIRSGELIRRFPLAPRSIVQPIIEHIYVSTDLCVVCVLGHELFVVRFPAVVEKD